MNDYILIEYADGDLANLPTKTFKGEEGLKELLSVFRRYLTHDVKSGELGSMPILSLRDIKKKGYHKIEYSRGRGVLLTNISEHYCDCCKNKGLLFQVPRGKHICRRCLKSNGFIG
ncbi:hypothetical protein D3C81_09290 [compost metagenome]